MRRKKQFLSFSQKAMFFRPEFSAAYVAAYLPLTCRLLSAYVTAYVAAYVALRQRLTDPLIFFPGLIRPVRKNALPRPSYGCG